METTLTAEKGQLGGDLGEICPATGSVARDQRDVISMYKNQ